MGHLVQLHDKHIQIFIQTVRDRLDEMCQDKCVFNIPLTTMQLNNCPETNESSKIHMILIQTPFVLDAITTLEWGYESN